METRTIGAGRRSRARLVVVVVALAIAATVLTVQAGSILSTTVGPPSRSALVTFDPQPPKRAKECTTIACLRKDGVDRQAIRAIKARKSG
jgi:hypothetical protein